MFILINTFDLSVNSQPDGWSSSPIFVGNWVERDFETARVTSLGLVDTQAPFEMSYRILIHGDDAQQHPSLMNITVTI